MRINLTTMNPKDLNERSQKNLRFINYKSRYLFIKYFIRILPGITLKTNIFISMLKPIYTYYIKTKSCLF